MLRVAAPPPAHPHFWHTIFAVAEPDTGMLLFQQILVKPIGFLQPGVTPRHMIKRKDGRLPTATLDPAVPRPPRWRRFLWWALAAIATLSSLSLGWSIFMASTPQPSYSVERRDGDIEIRVYDPLTAAEVEVQGERTEPIGAGFRPAQWTLETLAQTNDPACVSWRTHAGTSPPSASPAGRANATLRNTATS